jgi:hypothetical protein
MSNFKFNYESVSENLFCDNAKSNSEIRKANIKTLEGLGFLTCGKYSTSGAMRTGTWERKPAIFFGVRCNIAGKRSKYFTLVKDYNSETERNSAFVSLANTLVSL